MKAGQLHPGDLKPALSKALNKILQYIKQESSNTPCISLEIFQSIPLEIGMEVYNIIYGLQSSSMSRLIVPVRDHFKNDPAAKELLKRVKRLQSY
ncbi:unnamed protein product [Camellia sinensis]